MLRAIYRVRQRAGARHIHLPPADFVYKTEGGGSLLALRPTHPKKILTQNLAEGRSNLNKRPLVGPTQTPSPPLVLIPCKQSLAPQSPLRRHGPPPGLRRSDGDPVLRRGCACAQPTGQRASYGFGPHHGNNRKLHQGKWKWGDSLTQNTVVSCNNSHGPAPLSLDNRQMTTMTSGILDPVTCGQTESPRVDKAGLTPPPPPIISKQRNISKHACLYL